MAPDIKLYNKITRPIARTLAKVSHFQLTNYIKTMHLSHIDVFVIMFCLLCFNLLSYEMVDENYTYSVTRISDYGM